MRVVAIDFEAEELLKGTRGNARKARLALLEELASAGVSLEELRRAVDEDRLALLPVERLLAGDARYTAAEVAKKSGVEVEFLEKQRQALGLPVPDRDEKVYTGDDLEAARRVRGFREAGMPDDEMLEVARVLGMSMARVAEAGRGALARALTRPGDTEHDVALRFVEATRQMGPLLGELFEYVYKLHQLEVVRRDVVGRAQLAGEAVPGASDVAVCFADLVEFTKLGDQLPPEELGSVATRLGEIARETAAPPVSLVKLIGDAAMLVSTDAAALLDAALALVEAADSEGEGFPLLRAGVAYGPALNRGGDWYGRPVNMAARITDIARPGSVLCAEAVKELGEDGYRWSFAGERHLKGIGDEVALYRARREEPEDA
jgi:adenylate cyclase